jgi:ribosome-associated toxin RatA of RatAB toxin-antitoxin module
MSFVPADLLPRDKSPILRVRLGKDGLPVGAAAVARIDYPPSRVWSVITDLSYAYYIPMVHRARRDGDRVTFELRFKIGLFSVGFEFTAEVITQEADRSLELRWLSGDPQQIRLRFTVIPTDDERACLVEGDGEFDVMSLGWLVKYFLKHHPEIQFGIMPGVALALVDSLRRALESEADTLSEVRR